MNIPTLIPRGTDLAWHTARLFRENLRDLVVKVDRGEGEYEAGFFHTSTERGPGTNYYDDVWSRDGGRGLIELARFGFIDEAVSVARYFLRHMNGGDHWSRCIHGKPSAVAVETDGNAMALLGIYNAWACAGRGADLAEEFLPGCLKVVAWATRAADESPYGSLLPCASELSGNPSGGHVVYAIYPNAAFAYALSGVAEMAAAAGSDEATQAEALRRRIADSIRDLLIAKAGQDTLTPEGIWRNGIDGRDGSSYDNAYWEGLHFPIFHWTRQIPYIVASDVTGYGMGGSLSEEVDRRSFAYLLSEMWKGRFFRKYGFVSNTCWSGMGDRHDDTMCGYGQSYFTQGCLMADHVHAYTLCLEGMAKLAYDGAIALPATYERSPWLLHECFNHENYEEGFDHTFGRMTGDQPGGMDNPGDEGNLVQMAEALKCYRLVVGVDDLRPGRLRIAPRLPWSWDRLEVEGFPVCLAEGQARISYVYNNDLARGEAGLRLTSSLPLPACRIRLGPFSLSAEIGVGLGAPERTETAQWLWIDSGGGTEIEASVRIDG